MPMEARRNTLNKKGLFISLLIFFSNCSYAQRDYIILRDGSSQWGNIDVVSTDNTTFENSHGERIIVPNTNIYMIKYRQRGNVFFTEDGKRFSGETDGKIPNGAAAIYLLQGKEVIGYHVAIEEDRISYNLTRKSNSEAQHIPTDSVFLILYHDGTKDMLNDFESVKQKREKELAEQRRLEEEARLEELRAHYPKDVTITTVRNLKIEASLLWEDSNSIVYRRNQKNSPVYCMDRSNIKEVSIKE